MFKTLSVVFAATMLCLIAGCDKTEVAAPAEDKGNSLGIKADCIICVDHPMDVTDKTPHCEYKGKAYYFCSDDCLKTFEKDPEKALATYKEKKSPASQPATAPGH